MSGHTDTYTYTHTQDNYSNPRCACAPRVNNTLIEHPLQTLLHCCFPNLTSAATIITLSRIIDSIVRGLETYLINTFPADSSRCAVDNIVDSFHGCF